ncbi:MAG: hypothetical protein ABI822_14955 [Bryobacteraceae bacterium]
MPKPLCTITAMLQGEQLLAGIGIDNFTPGAHYPLFRRAAQLSVPHVCSAPTVIVAAAAL